MPAYAAFYALSPERLNGFGEGFIPRHLVRQYAADEGLDADELVALIRAADAAYLEARKAAREREKEMESRVKERAMRRGRDRR